ncbi:MAG: hypothetical protein R6V27_10240 [Balneolaceae bacterium]
MADAATCALAGQQTPDGYYNIERMLKLSVAKGARVKSAVLVQPPAELRTPHSSKVLN